MAVTPARRDPTEDELKYRAAVSEGTLFRLGGSISFINQKQYDVKTFFLNGPYKVAEELGDTDALDGLYPILFDMEIIGVFIFNIVSGSSGTTELDVLRRTAPGGAGSSIFSTRPKLTSSSPNYAFVGRDALSGNALGGGAWSTTPVFAGGGDPFNVNAGDVLTLNLISAMSGAENAGLVLFFRPR